MNGYEMFCMNRQHKNGGGVALYIDEAMDCKIIESMSMAVEEVFECISVEIVLQKRRSIIVSPVYRAPGSDMNLFKDWIERLFDNKTNREIILCGDYNIDLLNKN